MSNPSSAIDPHLGKVNSPGAFHLGFCQELLSEQGFFPSDI
jgi:hypothetical protein